MRFVTKIMACAASLALVASSTVAVAAQASVAQASVQAPVAQPVAPNAWLMLSVLSPTRSVALGGANAAAQPADLPPPAPEVAGGALAGGAGQLVPFVLWFGLIALALTDHGESGVPNSPA